jgi:hypothetical protein
VTNIECALVTLWSIERDEDALEQFFTTGYVIVDLELQDRPVPEYLEAMYKKLNEAMNL